MDMVSYLMGLEAGGGGGGGGGVESKDVDFIDYDGTVVYSYTAEEFAQLSALPANPSHDGLTAQGWNWTLADAKTYVAECGQLDIGQMYVTTSGATEIDIELEDGWLAPYLEVAVNGTVTVDWGDSSATDTLTGTSYTTNKYVQHTYAAAGKYTIKLTVSGAFTFYNSGNSGGNVLTDANKNGVLYSATIKAIRFGSGITSLGQHALVNCINLRTVTIPNTITAIGTGAFMYCYSLEGMVIPKLAASVGLSTFSMCIHLQRVSLPNAIDSIPGSFLSNCYNLERLSIPSAAESIGTSSFYGGSIRYIAIPSGVTSIGGSAFSLSYNLQSVTIPATVTDIGANAFSNCKMVTEYHFLGEEPPTLGSTALTVLPAYCTIYVPSGYEEDYKTGSGWASYAGKIVGE